MACLCVTKLCSQSSLTPFAFPCSTLLRGLEFLPSARTVPCLCPELPLLPVPKGNAIPRDMVTIACFLAEFKSSWLFAASTASHKFSMGLGF